MAVGDPHLFPGFLTPEILVTQLSFQSHRILFSHASEVKGENTPEGKFASTGYRTHNHQVMSQTRSQVSHPDGLLKSVLGVKIYQWVPIQCMV